MLLGFLHLDNGDGVALAVPSIVVVDNNKINLVIPLDDRECAPALPLDTHYLQCAPKLFVLREHPHDLHLLHAVVVGDGAMARGGVGIFKKRLEDVFGEAVRLDSALMASLLHHPYQEWKDGRS